MHNKNETCWNCPAANFKGNVDFRACGQTKEELREAVEENDNLDVMIECRRRPELGHFEPTITFEQCTEWTKTEYGYMLENMSVMVLGMDGYLGWTLALKLAAQGFDVSGVDNLTRREAVEEKDAHSLVPVAPMDERIEAAREVLDVDLDFREIDIRNRDRMRAFLKEKQPESIVHYGEIPSAPYSMVDADHALEVQENNTLGTLGLLYLIKDTVPESSLVKLGTMGEYGTPLTGRPLFEGMFPADATLNWDDREWSLGGELIPRNPPSFYHVGKVQDTYNIFEACKYWWLRSYDVMQGVIYGVHTEEVSADPRLRTRFDVDEWFGTVLNRFVAQAVLGQPLTVYGEGEQIRGFIGLADAMQCMTRLILSPPEPGQYDVVNQVSAVYRIRDLAETVARVAQREFNMDVHIQRLENPRVEADRHPIEVVADKLPDQFDFEPGVELEEEIYRMIKLLRQDEIRSRIASVKHTISPRTRWSGDQNDMNVLEEYEPGSKRESTGLKKKLTGAQSDGSELAPISDGEPTGKDGESTGRDDDASKEDDDSGSTDGDQPDEPDAPEGDSEEEIVDRLESLGYL